MILPLEQQELNLNEDQPLVFSCDSLLCLCRQDPLFCVAFSCAWQADLSYYLPQEAPYLLPLSWGKVPFSCAPTALHYD